MLKLAVVVVLAVFAGLCVEGSPTIDATAKDVEFGKVFDARNFNAVEKLAKSTAEHVIKGAKGKAEAEAAKAKKLLRKQRQDLKLRRKACRKLDTSSKRDDCLTLVRKEQKRVKREASVVKDFLGCSGSKERTQCVRKVALAYLKLRPNMVVLAQDQKVVVKKVEKVVKDVKKEKKVSSSKLRKDVAAAIAALYKRLGDIRKEEHKCNSLESGSNYKKCIAPVKAALRRNRKERELVKKLHRCRNKKDRARCARKYEDRLLALVAPGDKKTTPMSVNELDNTVVESAEKRLLKIAKYKRDLRKCESRRCRRQLKRKIRAEQRQIDGLRPRFSPRRKCLEQRSAMRSKEFRLRAREHALLTRIHRRATECSSIRCTAKQELQQRKLEKSAEKRRKAFSAEWKKLRCPFVAPANNFKKVKRSLKKIENKSLKSLRSMRQRLVQLYAKLDECDTGACREKVRSDIKDLKKLIALLVSVQQRTLRKKRRDHRKRARLHRLLTKYYLLAADCADKECRLAYRTKLRRLVRRLKKMDRDEIGRRTKAVKGMNKYYRLLQKALKRCPRSSLGRDCRKMVVHAFRAGTELRVKALIQYLKAKAEKKTKAAVKKCGADKKCVAKAQEKLQKRLVELRVRDMRINKRRALRLCELTKDQKKCRQDLEKEWSRDKKIAQVDAGKKASVVVKKVQDKEKQKKEEKAGVSAATGSTAKPVTRAASATVTSVSMAVLAIVALVLVF